jgi:hypothetical protein
MRVKPDSERYSVTMGQKASNTLKRASISSLCVRALKFLCNELLKRDVKTSNYVRCNVRQEKYSSGNYFVNAKNVVCLKYIVRLIQWIRTGNIKNEKSTFLINYDHKNISRYFD